MHGRRKEGEHLDKQLMLEEVENSSCAPVIGGEQVRTGYGAGGVCILARHLRLQ